MRSHISFVTAALISASVFVSAGAIAQTASSTPPPDQTNGDVVPLGSPSQLADRCAALLIQFDGEIGAHSADAKADKAKKLRASGEKQCKAGNHQGGIDSLTQALKNIGLKPRA